MPRIFVLDVPEFAGLVELAQLRDGFVVKRLSASYLAVGHANEIKLSRRGLRLKPAVWFGLLTGGYEGRIVEYTRNVLRLVDSDEQGLS
jgi:hypothetical protein